MQELQGTKGGEKKDTRIIKVPKGYEQESQGTKREKEKRNIFSNQAERIDISITISKSERSTSS
eukprot:184223-Ditylum_brightwellii.AAC.1